MMLVLELDRNLSLYNSFKKVRTIVFVVCSRVLREIQTAQEPISLCGDCMSSLLSYMSMSSAMLLLNIV